MVNWATDGNYNFLYINKTVPMKERYRKNLKEIINLEVFRNLTVKDSARSYESRLNHILNINQDSDASDKHASKRRRVKEDDRGSGSDDSEGGQHDAGSP
jgi:hypothetical protein